MGGKEQGTYEHPEGPCLLAYCTAPDGSSGCQDIRLHAVVSTYTLTLYFLLCSQNILMDEHGQGMLGDFGFSLELPKVQEGRSTFTAVGYACSERYYPSESTHGRFSTKSDVYSYGVVSLL